MIKNSYDADATEVKVIFNNASNQDDNSIEVYALEQEDYQLAGRYTGNDAAHSVVIADFEAPLGKVFFEE